jgi:hypothetical protein
VSEGKKPRVTKEKVQTEEGDPVPEETEHEIRKILPPKEGKSEDKQKDTEGDPDLCFIER